MQLIVAKISRAAAFFFLASSFSFSSVVASKSKSKSELAILRGVDDDFEIEEAKVLLEETRGTFVIVS